MKTQTKEAGNVRGLVDALQGGLAGFGFVKNELALLSGDRAALAGLVKTLEECNASQRQRRDFLSGLFADRIILTDRGAKGFFGAALEAARIVSDDPANALRNIDAEIVEFAAKWSFVCKGGKITPDGEVIR